MELTGKQRKYLRQEIQRVLDKHKLRRILRENQEKLNRILYDQLPSDTAFQEQAVNLIEELENRELIYVFIEVVREDENCSNFAQSLSDNENNNSPNSSEDKIPSNQSGTEVIEGESQPNANLDDLDDLKNLLKQEKWIEADIETRKLLLDSIGNPKFVNEENFQNIKCDLLRGIDKLWREESKGRFGFSVQKEIWEDIKKSYSSVKEEELIERFGIKVGWYDEDRYEWLDIHSIKLYDDIRFQEKVEYKAKGCLPTLPRSNYYRKKIQANLIPYFMKKLKSCNFL
jgi:hypothetical protein